MLGFISCFSPSVLETVPGKNAPITVSGVVAVALLVSSRTWGCASWARDWTRRVTVRSNNLCDCWEEFSREIRMSCVAGWGRLEISG